ncbi:MAG: DNA-directed polymerase subunit beta, partial [Chlamydiia bacterium]|nr:DNA-directed polymerase subunit beta [Chlamydiia bacterium]
MPRKFREKEMSLKKPPRRISFFDKEDILDLPNLIEVQIKSYDQFLQKNVLAEERQNIGLQEVYNELFPIKS